MINGGQILSLCAMFKTSYQENDASEVYILKQDFEILNVSTIE